MHGRDGVSVVAVASDKPERGARASPAARGADRGVSAREFDSRAERDARWPSGWPGEVELVVLAGYMQLLSPEFLARFDAGDQRPPGAAPAFPGLHAVEQALEYGVKVFGVTVHFVDAASTPGR